MKGQWKIDWIKLDEDWYQKVSRGKTRGIKISYHYHSKTKSDSQIIELNIPQAKQLCNLKLIEKDLRDIKLYLSEYKKNFEEGESKYKLNNTPYESMIAKSLLTTIIIHYARCCPGGKKRTNAINESDISDSNIATHKLLIELRNTYIAHSDHSKYENCAFVIPIPPAKKYKQGRYKLKPVFELYQTIGMDGLVHEIENLINDVYGKIFIRMSKLEKHIYGLLDKINDQKLYSFLKSKEKRITLCTEDLSKISD